MTDLPFDQYDSRFQLLDENGTPLNEEFVTSLDDEFFLELYRNMKRARLFDERAINLQRQGRLGTYAPCQGQEGCQVAAIMALRDDDPIFPTYRETPALLTRDVDLKKILLYWGGDERGSKIDSDRGIFPLSIPVGSHALHAVGAVRAQQIKNQEAFSVAFFGDGATSEGDLLSAMNFAGVWDAPVLFFCQNNQWAISVKRQKQTGSETIAQKARAFGFPGIRIDGNDPLATYHTVKEAQSKAVQESTPIFVEAETYRLGDHTTSDDAGRYRSEEEVEEWKAKDPIKRTRVFLEEKGLWDDSREDELEDKIEEEIKASIKEYEETDPPDPKDIFQYTYADMTPELEQQYRELMEEIDGE